MKVPIRHFTLLALGWAVSVLSAQAKPAARVSIPIAIRTVTSAHWSEAEVRERFANAQKIFADACGIDLTLHSLVMVSEPNLQDIHGAFNEAGVADKVALRAQGGDTHFPTLLYVREVFHEQQQGSLVAQAYMLGDRNTPGNLWVTEFPRVHPIHGTAVISHHYSQANPAFTDIFHSPGLGPTDVDAHEIAHLLLNDAGHDQFPDNLMSINGARPTFKASQCHRMRTYYQREHGLKREAEKDYSRYMRNSTRRLRARPW